MPESKEKNINIRISESELNSIRKASELLNLSVSAYIRMLVVADAEKRNHIAELRLQKR